MGLLICAFLDATCYEGNYVRTFGRAGHGNYRNQFGIRHGFTPLVDYAASGARAYAVALEKGLPGIEYHLGWVDCLQRFEKVILRSSFSY
jgi:hypothetical protein